MRCFPAAVTFLALAQLAATAAVARPCAPIAFGAPHPTATQAATVALRTLFRDARPYESGGFVIEKDGRFRASKAVTQRSRTEVNYCIALPRGAKLAALYHSHVGDPEFSPRDRRNAERVGVPSYIGTIRGGDLFVYEPRERQARELRSVPRPEPRARDLSPPAAPSTWPDRLVAAAQRVWAVLVAQFG
jgi:proteasome lid subunit RPN8/RPN11